ncbi:hypothetical protein GON26_11785 [Flavobacterium sp. GA093]|uniref:Uncharacterized protein n=1 Tax=Flavobacterium hydrocarbonoxydans TaxID=2683249 RepID=A0A6I4NTQ1_9FLAO|nr:hypothetical protein [Flavobacterium hydrocarbonoxydans]MWB95049.1 hypothetical protein [Flavobacterium hydrocarbonoxydans]
MNKVLKSITLAHQLKIAFVFFLLTINTMVFAQQEPELSVIFLDNDKIASVNVDEKEFLKSISAVIEICKKDFSTISADQKIAFLVIAHKTEKPTFQLYSNPKISTAIETKFLEQVAALNIGNTKLVDFPILISVNSKFDETNTDFKDIDLPNQKKVTAYLNADLKTKAELNKNYAINEALPVLAAYQTIVDAKFEGVKNFGSLVAKTAFRDKQDVIQLTGNNPDYWRATMEMELDNQLIPVTKIFMLISQGEFDYAKKYIEIVKMFSNPETITHHYLIEITDRLKLFEEQLNTEINKGIAEHDKGEFEKAISIYNTILEEYPNSSWANFEIFYSQSELNKKTGNTASNSIENWNLNKGKILNHNPFYGLPIGAQSPEDAYLLDRRNSLSQLFKNKSLQIKDIETYADVAMDLKIYDFAAQLYWYTSSYNDKKSNSIYKLLYCLEKLGVPNLKNNFKGNFEKEFKSIEKNQEKDMVKSDAYKSY